MFFLLFLLPLFLPKNVYAQKASTFLVTMQGAKQKDHRVEILQEFLKQYNSPLADNAADIVQSADENNIDWKLIPAISGVESTFGQAVPANSYNGWGWGVYGDNVIRFTSWSDAIKTISKGLRHNYIDKLGSDDVYAIGSVYAASPTWASRVTYFMQKIDQYDQDHQDVTLPLTL